MSNGGNTIAEQTHLTSGLCNPTMLIMVVALANIDHELGAIQEIQQEMLDFII